MDGNAFLTLGGPLEPLPLAGQTRAAILQKFGKLTRMLGGDARDILERHNLDSLALSNPRNLISSESLLDIFFYCSDRLSDPMFGFHLAGLQNQDPLGPVSTLCRAALDLQSALEVLVEYIPIVQTPDLRFELVVGETIAELRWAHDVVDTEYCAQASQYSLLQMLRFLKTLTLGAFTPQYASVNSGIPTSHRKDFEVALGCPVTANAAFNSLAFHADALRQPLPTTDAVTWQLMGAYLRQVKESGRLDTLSQVEGYVRAAMSTGACDIDACAARIGISRRSIQNHLRTSGMSFSEVLDAERSRQALRYLQTTSLPISEIALMLGYADHTSFGRAVRRWTGRTPRELASRNQRGAVEVPEDALRSRHQENRPRRPAG